MSSLTGDCRLTVRQPFHGPALAGCCDCYVLLLRECVRACHAWWNRQQCGNTSRTAAVSRSFVRCVRDPAAPHRASVHHTPITRRIDGGERATRRKRNTSRSRSLSDAISIPPHRRWRATRLWRCSGRAQRLARQPNCSVWCACRSAVGPCSGPDCASVSVRCRLVTLRRECVGRIERKKSSDSRFSFCENFGDSKPSCSRYPA